MHQLAAAVLLPGYVELSGSLRSRLLWSRLYEIPRLCRSASPLTPPPSVRTFHIVCRIPQPASGQQSGACATPFARASTIQRTCNTWHPFRLGKRAARCPFWSVMRLNPVGHVDSSVAEDGGWARHAFGRSTGDPGASSGWCCTWQSQPRFMWIISLHTFGSPPSYSSHSAGLRPAGIACATSSTLSSLPPRTTISAAAAPFTRDQRWRASPSPRGSPPISAGPAPTAACS